MIDSVAEISIETMSLDDKLILLERILEQLSGSRPSSGSAVASRSIEATLQ